MSHACSAWFSIEYTLQILFFFSLNSIIVFEWCFVHYMKFEIEFFIDFLDCEASLKQ